MKRILTTALVALALAACGGDGTPTAEIEAASPTSLDPAVDASDDLTIQIAYTDPDGDLGGGVAEVHDCRSAAVVSRFDLPQIASKEAVDEGLEISGELTIVVADVGDVAPGKKPSVCADTKSFCVVLIDEAGNESEPACTKPIQIAAQKP